MATAWVQKYDFSCDELGELSEGELIAAFEAVDWPLALSKVDVDNPNACCPPGFGINAGPNILHLCPEDTKNMFFHLHCETTHKILGLFPVKRKQTKDVSSYPLKNARTLIRQFMAGDYAAIQAID